MANASDSDGISVVEETLNHLTSANFTIPPRSALHRAFDTISWVSQSTTILLERSAVALHMGNYVKNRLTGARSFEPMSVSVRLGMHLLYCGTQQQKMLQWNRVKWLLREQSIKIGAAYDTPESTSHIRPFIEDFGLWPLLLELEQPDITAYPSFNAFFARKLRPEARPISQPYDPAVSSSPADCRMMVYQYTNVATMLWIKGIGFSVAALLDDAELAGHFDGGAIVIARLAPQDYHRWHAPVDGVVQSVREISGTYYTVNPQAVNQATTLDVFCTNRRSVMVLEREIPRRAPIAVVAIGAMLVGSIRYEEGVTVPGTRILRGQRLGYFQYGGSTVVVLYPKGELTVDADLILNSTFEVCETLMQVGWRVGRAEV